MTGEHFTPRAFADAAEGMNHPVRARVRGRPPQLQRASWTRPTAALPPPPRGGALARFDAVLVGGSPRP
ncbi:hypothetical protein QJS66_19050 [Kocuria rhizophila]|nr:hypothetical protein QJS66_19050 [Kocuria rhizophila]